MLNKVMTLLLFSTSSLFATFTWDYPPKDLSVAGQDATLEQIVSDDSGHAIAVWRSSARLQAVYSEDYGHSWSAPITISGLGQDVTNRLDIAMGNNGNAICC